ncbi:MAG: FixH family protein [Chloroflexales bacterium]
MRRVILRLVSFAILVALIAACAAPAGPSTTRLEQVVDGITIGLELPLSPKLNAAQDFVISLADAQGKPIDNASVYIDLLMPAMPMGTNRPVASSEGKGRYLAQAAYTMTGEWEVTVFVELGGVTHKAVFTQQVSAPTAAP